MNQIAKLYIFFDTAGQIRCISPLCDAEMREKFNYTLMPLADVEDFIYGKRNASDYTVKQNMSTLEYYLYKKTNEDLYLKKIENWNSILEPQKKYKNNWQVLITKNITTKQLTVEITNSVKNALDTNTFPGKNINLYFIHKDNPNILVEKIKIPINELRNNLVYTTSYQHSDNVLLSIKKYFHNYTYTIEE